MKETDVKELLRNYNNKGYSVPSFVKVYLNQKDKEGFKKMFIREYNKHIELFKQTYEEVKEKENRNWDFVGWPSRITKRNIKNVDDGLIINLETYDLEYYGTDVQPIVFSEITKVFKLLNDYEYEGVVSENEVFKYPEPYSYVIGNKGREEFDYTWNRVNEYISSDDEI